jgi:hypothetical protein
MRHKPSRNYAWILHIKDNFSKLSMLYALHSKQAEEVAAAVAEFIKHFYPPGLIQCNNGKEFKGALLILLRRYSIQIINSSPRQPQTQGLVEQANGVVKAKICV